MKVILLQDVARIGKRHTVVEVPDGYALNQLVPKKMAVPATAENLKRVQHASATKAATASHEASAFADALAALKDTVLTVAVDLNDKNHMFRALSAEEVVAAAAAAGVTIAPATVRFATPIKEGGTHEVQLVHGSTKGTVKVAIVKK